MLHLILAKSDESSENCHRVIFYKQPCSKKNDQVFSCNPVSLFIMCWLPQPNLYTYITYLILPDSCYLAAFKFSYVHTYIHTYIHTFSQHNSNSDTSHYVKKTE
jgi:hypothetical protein